MSYLLNINSSNDDTVGDTHDFTFALPIPLRLSGQWSVSLVNSSLWYSYTNISANQGNNVLTYSPDNGTTTRTLTISDGQYNITDINQLLEAKQLADGDDVAGVVQLVITPNYNTSKVELSIGANFEVDFSTSDLYLLFGYSASQAAAPLTAGSYEGDNIADITGGRNKISICTSLLEGADSSYSNGSRDAVLYSFSPNSSPGSLMMVEPNERVYLNMLKDIKIPSIRVYLRDNNGNTVDMRGETCSYLIHLKKVF